MQNTSKAQQGQSFIDVVLQQAGNYEEVVNAAILNGKSITDDVVIGEDIGITRVLDSDNTALFRQKQPATAIREIDYTPEPEGIGFWIVGKTFKTS